MRWGFGGWGGDRLMTLRLLQTYMKLTSEGAVLLPAS